MGNQNTSAKKVFEQLDGEKTGCLTLDKLLRIRKLPDCGLDFVPHTPFLLYRFDESHEGNIDYKEFTKLLRHLQDAEKKMKDQRNNAPVPKVWRSVDKNSKSEFDLSRDAEVPMITGNSKHSNDLTRSIGSFEDLEEEELEHLVQNEVKRFFDSLKGQQGKQEFLTWLFHLVDVDASNTISTDELCCMLNAIAEDGVELEHLFFPHHKEDEKQVHIQLTKSMDGGKSEMGSPMSRSSSLYSLAESADHSRSSIPKSVSVESLKKEEEPVVLPSDESKERFTDLAKRIMEEYDTGKTGSLSYQQFLLLGDLILKNYELFSTQDDSNHIGNYKLKRKIGCGASGAVWLAQEADTRDRRAIKIIKKGDCSNLSRVDVEIKAMLMLSHLDVVQLYEVLETNQEVHFIMELCGGGSLSDHVNIEPLSENTTRFYFKQLVEAVSYCHSQGVCHRDLKLENLLLDDDGNLKITDFGHAGIFQEGWDMFSTAAVGSLAHLSPEQIQGNWYSGEKIDIWSCGIILYRLLTGNLPFFDPNPTVFVNKILKVDYTIPDFLSDDVKDLITKILREKSEDRVPLEEIEKHPWLQGESVKISLKSQQFPLDWGTNIDAVWKALESVSNQKNIHFHELPKNTKKHKNPYIVKYAHCTCPVKDLKFSVKYIADPVKKEHLLRFIRKEGESWQYKKLVKWLFKDLMNNTKFNGSKEQTKSKKILGANKANLVTSSPIEVKHPMEIAEKEAEKPAPTSPGSPSSPTTPASTESEQSSNMQKDDRQSLSAEIPKTPSLNRSKESEQPSLSESTKKMSLASRSQSGDSASLMSSVINFFSGKSDQDKTSTEESEATATTTTVTSPKLKSSLFLQIPSTSSKESESDFSDSKKSPKPKTKMNHSEATTPVAKTTNEESGIFDRMLNFFSNHDEKDGALSVELNSVHNA